MESETIDFSKYPLMFLLKKYYTLMDTKFDSNSDEHMNLLTKLFNNLKPDVKLEGLVSEHWKSIGFQNKDPSTDFRGMGKLYGSF